ncbi:MAG: filamentous hemagglutinin N-terminal domain-containing protein, partial [Burkholderiaceae bacterium]
MNHVYRNIWNAHTGTWVAAAETIRSRSKRSGAVKLTVLASALLLAGWAHAQGVPSVSVSSGNTRAYVSPNGVTIVDIATANAAGLSHNRYTQYNVNPSGLVLNNGNNSTMLRQSQLAGQITANLNLTNQANVILNEVVANNRSTLAGYTEVLGGRADVVLANPYGITCSGCGFINTDRATLTTGIPTLNADGSLKGFSVNQGDILIQGNGLNGSAQQILDLVTRSVKIDGQVNAQDLGITTGANTWDYASRSVTGPATASGTAPAYAIDSSALGGMYANRIKLVATDAGVGVRMLGDAAAGVDDFTLDAAGRIELTGNKVSAQRDIQLASTDPGAAAIALSNASATAGRNASVQSTQGGLNLAGGMVVAGADLQANAASIDASGASRLQAGGALGAATLSGDMSLGTSAVKAGSDLALSSAGTLSIGAGDGQGQGVQSTGGNVRLQATGGIANEGVVSADAGSLTVRANGTLDNGGTLNAGQSVDIADATGGATQTVNNRGDVLAGQNLLTQGQNVINGGWLQAGGSNAIAADNLSNSGTIVALGGDTQLRVDQNVTNSGKVQSAQNVTLSSRSGGASAQLENNTGGQIRALAGMDLNAAVLDNSGTLVTGGSARLASSTLSNSGAAYAQGNLTVATGTLDNTGSGTLEAGNALDIGASGAIGNATGAVMTGGSVKLTGTQGLDNGGLVYASAGNAQLRVSGTLDNSGRIQTTGTLDVADSNGGASQAVTNSGAIQASDSSAIKAGSLTNSGVWLLSTQAASPASSITVDGQLINSQNAVLQAYTDATIGAGNISNQAGGLIRTGQSLSITTSDTVGVSNAGTLQAGSTLSLSGGGAFDNAAGAIALGDGLQIAMGSIDNSGNVQGGGSASTSVAASGQLSNQAGGVITVATAATGGGAISGGTIANQGTMQSLGTLALDVGSGGLTNTGDGTSNGRIVADGNVTLQAAGSNSYAATVGGSLQSGGALTISGDAGSSLDVQGTAHGASASVNTGKVNVGASGVLATDKDMTLDAGKLTLGVTGSGATATTGRVLAALSGAGTGTVKVSSDLSNSGLIFSGHDLQVTAPNVEVGATGALSALNDLTVRATAAPLDLSSATPAAGTIANGGLLYAGNTVSAEANQIVNGALADGTVVVDAQINSDKDVALRANTLVNNTVINAAQNIGIVATTFRNEVSGGDTRKWVRSADSATKEIAHRDDGDAGANLDEAWLYQYTYTNVQQYGTALPSLVPQITAGNDLTIAFHDAKNLGATLYAGNAITLQGFSSDPNQSDGSKYASLGIADAAGHGFKLDGATFVNDNLALESQSHTVQYSETTKYKALGPAKYYDHALCSTTGGGKWDAVCYTDGYNDTHTSTWANPANSGLYSKKLTGSGFALTNNGATGNSSQTVDTSANDLSSGLTGGAPSTTPTGKLSSRGAALSVATTAGREPPSALAKSTPSSYTPGQALASYLADNAANGVNGTSFGGINITLPGNPNGYFVQTLDPNAHYLVETNPLYLSGGSALGSDYLAKLLGYNPDQLGLRLGDASYEAWLVKQQLIKQTGSAVLASYANADTQMKDLMEHAASQSGSLGLVYGKALTPAQQAKLKQDIVWMVQTEIDGKTVLAPVVYLAQSTKENIATGAVISAQDANLSVSALTNTGGTLIGSNSLVVASTGDISNLSGLIQGGDVNLSSSEGSILNKTLSEGSGGKSFYTTQLGKTAGIQSTGNLSLDAKKDITNLGANMAAGGDASLKAGGDITFDTIQDKETNTTYGKVDHGFSTSTTSTTTQVKSGLTVGGNLAASAGNDITLAGTDAKVGGDAALDAGNDVNIIARENTSQTHSETHVAGVGVNNSLYGTTDITTDSKSGRNVGSNFDVGGNASLKAGNDVTVQGSNVDVKGKGKIDATNVNVLAGQNYDESTTTTKQTGVMQVSASSGKSANANASANATAGNGAASAGANAGASASGTGSAGLAFSSTTTTTDTSSDLKHVGSNVSFGGNLDVNAKNDVTLQGSNLHGGPETTVTAKNVNILAAEDESTSSHSVSHTSVGLLASTTNTAKADAGAQASASGKGGLPSANASGDANASVSSENRIDFVQTSKSKTSTLDTTHQGSTLGSSGNLTIKADNLNVAGSSLQSGGDMTLDANNQTFSAVNDRHETRNSSSSTSAGLYADAGASAGANAGGTAGVGGAQGGASASANASVEVGLYGSNTRSNSVEGSTTARTSSISSGGNLTRNATNSITDIGTQIDVGGDLNQSAKTITSRQAENTTYSSSSTATDTAKIGAYGEAGASVGVSGNVGPGASSPATKEASAGAGIRASYQHDDESSQSASSTAVVSNIHVGGNVHSTSSGATTLQGTQITAGKNVDLEGGSIDYAAAKNTSSSSSHDTSAGGSVSVDLVNKSASVGVNYDGNQSSEQSSTAVVGGITAGGNVNLKSSGDTRLEGTNIAAGNGTNITTGGNLTFAAAKNTSQSNASGTNVSVDVTAGKGEGSAAVGAGHHQSSASHDEDVAGSISSGAGGINITAGKNATFTGTQLGSDGNVAVAAGGDLAFNAAHTVDHSQSTGVDVAASASGGKKENVGGTRTGGMFSEKTGGHTMDQRSGSGSIGVSTSKSDSDVATGSTIRSGGNVTLSSGNNTTLEGTQVAAAGSVGVTAGGDVIQKAAVSKSSSSGVDFSASGSGSSLTPIKGKSGAGATGSGASGASKPGAAGTAGSGAAGSSGKSGAGSAGTTGKAGASTSNTGKAGSNTSGTGTGATGNGAGAKAPKTAAELTQKKGSGVVTLGVDHKSSSTSAGTTLSGGQGVTIVSGARNAATQQITVSVPVVNVPKGKVIQVKTADGKPLPSWLKLDPKSGKITGKPPADF